MKAPGNVNALFRFRRDEALVAGLFSSAMISKKTPSSRRPISILKRYVPACSATSTTCNSYDAEDRSPGRSNRSNRTVYRTLRTMQNGETKYGEDRPLPLAKVPKHKKN